MPSLPDHKVAALRKGRTLNPHPERVRDEAFQSGVFFDRRDLLQVKYEMVRRVRVDTLPAAHTAALFGVSRPTLYKAMSDFDAQGMAGLLPRVRGPKGGHKLTPDAMAFVTRERVANPAQRTSKLALSLAQQLGICVHPRSIDRALTRLKKKAVVRVPGKKGKRRTTG